MIIWFRDLSGASVLKLQPLSVPSSSTHLGLRCCGVSQAPEPHLTTLRPACPFPHPIIDQPFLFCSLFSHGLRMQLSSPPAFLKVFTSAWFSACFMQRTAALGMWLVPFPSMWPATELSHFPSLGISLCSVCPHLGSGLSEPAQVSISQNLLEAFDFLPLKGR